VKLSKGKEGRFESKILVFISSECNFRGIWQKFLQKWDEGQPEKVDPPT
jgi:hypothetical protein